MPIKKFFLLFLSIFFSFQICATELTFKLTPQMAFPFLSATTGDYSRFASFGGGALLETGVNTSIFNIGPTFGAFIIPKNSSSELRAGEDSIVTLIPVGIHASTLFYPASRLEFEFGISAGAYAGVTNGKYHYAPWYRASANMAFRLSPSLTIGLEGGWIDFQNNSYWGNPGMAGVVAGLSIRWKLDTEKVSGRVDGTLFQEESIFPILYSLYKTEEVGTIKIQNNETAEIRNVKISFRATDGYTASEIECGETNVIKKRKSFEVPLIADFNQKILQFTEEGKIPGEIVVNYELLGQKRTAVSDIIIPVYNRNQIRWGDPSILASFVSSTAPEILELSKYLVGVARSHLRTGLNRNMQFAMYLFEGVRLAGIKCEEDADTPYSSTHLDEDALDYIQYPFQTLLYRTGDCDDIGVLLMSLFESVGISAAFFPLDDDFVILFNTKIPLEKASNFFNGDTHFIPVDNEIWIPLSTKMLREGFMNSWYAAMDELNAQLESGEEVTLITLQDAWQNYPPLAFASGEDIDARSAESPLIKAADESLSRYVTSEFGPQITELQKQIKTDSENVTLLNKLALLYVRAGMYSAAKPVYEKSSELGSVSAMVNLGNIASLKKDYEEAKTWYERALQIDPENKSAKKNLNRVLGELE